MIIIIIITGSRYEPAPRFGHSTALIGEKLFLWGGWQKGSPQVHTSQEKTLQCLKIDVMNLNKGEWSQLETYGEPPLGVRGYATEVIGYNLYYFGGYCGHDFCRHNTFKLVINNVPYCNQSMQSYHCNSITYCWLHNLLCDALLILVLVTFSFVIN